MFLVLNIVIWDSFGICNFEFRIFSTYGFKWNPTIYQRREV